MTKEKKKATGYDKYVNWKLMIIPVILFFAILILPTPGSMQEVGIQYKVGPGAVHAFLAENIFQKKTADLEQWQLAGVQMMEQTG